MPMFCGNYFSEWKILEQTPFPIIHGKSKVIRTDDKSYTAKIASLEKVCYGWNVSQKCKHPCCHTGQRELLFSRGCANIITFVGWASLPKKSKPHEHISFPQLGSYEKSKINNQWRRVELEKLAQQQPGASWRQKFGSLANSFIEM